MAAESYRAYLEVFEFDGTTSFVPFKDVLLSIELQHHLAAPDRRVFRNVVNCWRKEGSLVEILYIGPKPIPRTRASQTL